MRVQMPDGSEMDIPPNMCPKCYIDVDREEGTATKMTLDQTLPAKSSEIDMAQIWICPDCQHKQIVIIDNPNYVKSDDVKADE